MLQCKHCGINLPPIESLREGKPLFSCRACGFPIVKLTVPTPDRYKMILRRWQEESRPETPRLESEPPLNAKPEETETESSSLEESV